MMLVLASVSEHDPFIDFYRPFYRLTLYILQPKIRILELNLHCQPSSLQKKEVWQPALFQFYRVISCMTFHITLPQGKKTAQN